MSTTSTQYAAPGRMGLYEPINEFSLWESTFKGEIGSNPDDSLIVPVDTSVGNKVKLHIVSFLAFTGFGLFSSSYGYA